MGGGDGGFGGAGGGGRRGSGRQKTSVTPETTQQEEGGTARARPRSASLEGLAPLVGTTAWGHRWPAVQPSSSVWPPTLP